MRPDDLGGFWEEAFQKVEPKDDAQREKLERLRQKLGESQRELAAELAKIKEQTERMMAPAEWDQKRAQATEEVWKETEFAARVTTALDEQIDLLARIVAATRVGSGS